MLSHASLVGMVRAYETRTMQEKQQEPEQEPEPKEQEQKQTQRQQRQQRQQQQCNVMQCDEQCAGFFLLRSASAADLCSLGALGAAVAGRRGGQGPSTVCPSCSHASLHELLLFACGPQPRTSVSVRQQVLACGQRLFARVSTYVTLCKWSQCCRFLGVALLFSS